MGIAAQFRSFPRKREFSFKDWVPAFAGTSGMRLVTQPFSLSFRDANGCGENQTVAPCVNLAPVPIGHDTPVPPSPQ